MPDEYMNPYPGYPWQFKFFTPSYTFEAPRFQVPNKRVAVEPFPEAPKAQVKGGVIAPMSGGTTTGLKVIFSGATYLQGQVVHVRAKLRDGSTYGKEIFEVAGQRFILIPEEEVLVVDTAPAEAQVTP